MLNKNVFLTFEYPNPLDKHGNPSTIKITQWLIVWICHVLTPSKLNNVYWLVECNKLKATNHFFYFKRKITKVLFGFMKYNGMKWIRVERNGAE
jgi:hypothetical protein